MVTSDTRQRAEQFLEDLTNHGASRLRRLSHASDAGADIPMAYTAVSLGDEGLALAVGRDMRLGTAMQERLNSAQRDIERDYWDRRRAAPRVSPAPGLVSPIKCLEKLDMLRKCPVGFFQNR